MPLSMAGLSVDGTIARDCFPGCTGSELFTEETADLQALDNDAYWDYLERHVQHGENVTPPADIYQPLEDWQTRVLAVEPGIYGQPLEASLHNVDLLHDPGALIHGTKERIEYNALAYCWGNPERCRLLLCDGHRCAITREAYRALQRLRSPMTRTYIWLDAVCINQADTLKKCQQVRKMLSIYKKATSVYVWLGEHRGASKLVVKRLAEMSIGSIPGDGISQHNAHDNLALKFRYHQVREAERHIATGRNRWKAGILDHTDSLATSHNEHAEQTEPVRAWSSFIRDTEHRWLWQMPPNAEVGDIVVAAEGARTPLLLRSSTAGDTYRYIGPVLVPEGGEIRYEPSAQINSIALCLADVFADCLRDGMLKAFDVV